MNAQLPAVDRFLEAVRTATIPACDAWADDARLDATVPNWRFSAVGADRIQATYATWFADPGSFEELRRLPVPGGEVVEYLLCWTEDGVPHTAHHIHVLDVVDDRIVADVVLCGGRWPAGLMAEMEAAGA
ncbi:MAG: hypothetical protein ACJ72E_13160 [Marmoricola sp.]